MGTLVLLAIVTACSIVEYSSADVSVNANHRAIVGDDINFTISGTNRTNMEKVYLVDNYGYEKMEKILDPFPSVASSNEVAKYVIQSDVHPGNTFAVTITLMDVTACDNGKYYFKITKVSGTDYDAYYVNVTVNELVLPPLEMVDNNDAIEYNEIGDILNFQCKLSAINVAGLEWQKKNTAGVIQPFESNERQGNVMSVKEPSQVCLTNASLWLNVTISASSSLKEFYYECFMPDGRNAKTRTIKIQAQTTTTVPPTTDLSTTGTPGTTSSMPLVSTPGSGPLTTGLSSSGVSSATSEVVTLITSGKGLSGTTLGSTHEPTKPSGEGSCSTINTSDQILVILPLIVVLILWKTKSGCFADKHELIQGGQDNNHAMDEMDQTGSCVAIHSKDQLKVLLASHTSVIVGFFSSQNSTSWTAFKKASSSMQGFMFARTGDEDLIREHGDNAILMMSKDGRKLRYAGEPDVLLMRDWVKKGGHVDNV